jgi:hypothetical protein
MREPATTAPKPESIGNLQIIRRRLASIVDNLKFDNLSLVQSGETGTLDGRYVNKYVLTAALLLNEPITLGRVEPLHGTFGHHLPPRCASTISTRQMQANPRPADRQRREDIRDSAGFN